MKLVLATRNDDKIAEMRQLLADLKIDLITYRKLPNFPNLEEGERSLEENALLKAREIHLAYGLPALADDTGLEIDALGGAPGVLSSRFAGVGATYAENRRKVLSLMRGVPPDGRKARFRCVVAIVDHRMSTTVEGVCEGIIIAEERGTHGFGYDSIFFLPDHGKTMAEIPPELKNRISHRALAFKDARQIIRKLEFEEKMRRTGYD